MLPLVSSLGYWSEGCEYSPSFYWPLVPTCAFDITCISYRFDKGWILVGIFCETSEYWAFICKNRQNDKGNLRIAIENQTLMTFIHSLCNWWFWILTTLFWVLYCCYLLLIWVILYHLTFYLSTCLRTWNDFFLNLSTSLTFYIDIETSMSSYIIDCIEWIYLLLHIFLWTGMNLLIAFVSKIFLVRHAELKRSGQFNSFKVSRAP